MVQLPIDAAKVLLFFQITKFLTWENLGNWYFLLPPYTVHFTPYTVHLPPYTVHGFGYYQTMNRNQAERKRLHAEQRAAIK